MTDISNNSNHNSTHPDAHATEGNRNATNGEESKKCETDESFFNSLAPLTKAENNNDKISKINFCNEGYLFCLGDNGNSPLFSADNESDNLPPSIQTVDNVGICNSSAEVTNRIEEDISDENGENRYEKLPDDDIVSNRSNSYTFQDNLQQSIESPPISPRPLEGQASANIEEEEKLNIPEPSPPVPSVTTLGIDIIGNNVYIQQQQQQQQQIQVQQPQSHNIPFKSISYQPLSSAEQGQIPLHHNTYANDSFYFTSSTNGFDYVVNNINEPPPTPTPTHTLISAQHQLSTSSQNTTLMDNMQNGVDNCSNSNRDSLSARKAKRKHGDIEEYDEEEYNDNDDDDEEIENTIKKKKRHRYCNKINSNCTCGPTIKDLPEDIFEKLTTQNKLRIIFNRNVNDPNKQIECDICGKMMWRQSLFFYVGNYFCKECAKKKQIPTKDLKYDLSEEENLSRRITFHCNRLDHSKGLESYIDYNDKKDIYIIKHDCSYCRMYKAMEYAEKKWNKKKKR